MQPMTAADQAPAPDGRPELLALRALKLGDLLVAVPALRALRKAHPDHRLILAAPSWLRPIADLAGCVDVLLPTPGLDAPLGLAAGRVDVAVNLHGNGPESRGRLEELMAPRRIGHRASGWDGPAWSENVHERERWTRLVRWHGILADPLDYRLTRPGVPKRWPDAVVVHVGAAYGSRLWPVDRFADVARVLARTHRVLFTGSGDERGRALAAARGAGLPEESVLAGELPLDAFAAVVADASLVISADTGAAHLASAFGRPSVVLFGPAPVSQWAPPPGPHIVLTDERLREGNVFSDVPDPALLAVTPPDVLEAAAALGIA